jgi:hypothetical protein
MFRVRVVKIGDSNRDAIKVDRSSSLSASGGRRFSSSSPRFSCRRDFGGAGVFLARPVVYLGLLFLANVVLR